MDNCTCRVVSGHRRKRISASLDTTNVDLFSMSQIPHHQPRHFRHFFHLVFLLYFQRCMGRHCISILGLMARRSDMAKQKWSIKSFAKQLYNRAKKL